MSRVLIKYHAKRCMSHNCFRAFMFLFIEVWMRILSTILANGIHTSVDSEDAWLNHGMNWRGIFGVYSILGEPLISHYIIMSFSMLTLYSL